MPDDPPVADNDRAPDAARLEVPHPNGALTKARSPHTRNVRRTVLQSALVLVLLAWGYAIWYSVSRPQPEPLDDASTALVREACSDAERDLRALPQVSGDDEPARRAERLDAENVLFETMLAAIGVADPPDHDGAVALRAWTADWRALLEERSGYAADLHDNVNRPDFHVPSESGATKPITVRMNDYALQHGLSACSTESLQAEIVDGERDYGDGEGNGGS